MRRIAAIVIPRLACEVARQKLRERDRVSTGPLAVILEPVGGGEAALETATIDVVDVGSPGTELEFAL